MSRNETPIQILSRLLGRAVGTNTFKPETTKRQATTVRTVRKAKAPALSTLLRENVQLDGFPERVGLVLVAEMVLQELERGGYGGVELRHTGRSTANLAEAAGIPVAVAERALMLLKARWLARYGKTEYQPDVLLWTPVRELEASPYTFNTSDVPGVYEPPERLDFKAAVLEERARAAQAYARTIAASAYKTASAAAQKPTKRGRGRPRKVPSWLRGHLKHQS